MVIMRRDCSRLRHGVRKDSGQLHRRMVQPTIGRSGAKVLGGDPACETTKRKQSRETNIRTIHNLSRLAEAGSLSASLEGSINRRAT